MSFKHFSKAKVKLDFLIMETHSSIYHMGKSLKIYSKGKHLSSTDIC